MNCSRSRGMFERYVYHIAYTVGLVVISLCLLLMITMNIKVIPISIIQ